MANINSSEWSPSVDIYEIVQMVEDTKKKFIEDEDESTLAIGIFGFLGDTEAKKIQTATIMTGELGNEMFPQRAKLDKNIVTHAIYCNVGDLNATPSTLLLNIGIKEDDINSYMIDDEFVLDHNSPIYIGEYEFHLEYDVILKRYKRSGSDKWLYSAKYDMDQTNRLSDINNPYLTQPFIINYNNFKYVFLQVKIRQYTIETIEDTMVSTSVIDNKSFTFNFTNQLAMFDVFVTENGVTTQLRPYLYGESIDIGVTNYCSYLYINDNTIRIGFDQKSYIPGLNADVKIIAYTTLGKSGNFVYKSSTDESGFYVDLESTRFSYQKITCVANCATNSENGKDKKSIEELKQLIPKLALSRGYITTETDLNNYFNMISDPSNRMFLRKKVDNQLAHVWYCFMLLKDQYGNVIPTNTLPLKFDLTDTRYVIPCEGDDERYIIPCGTTFCYDPTLGYCKYIPESDVPVRFSDNYYGDKYYYRTLYNIIVNMDPLYCAYYLSTINRDSYFKYNYVNDNLDLGFITNTYHSERNLLTDKNKYHITFSITQSINENYGLYYVLRDNNTNQEVITNNLKIFLVLNKDGEPYRYAEAEVTSFDEESYTMRCRITLETDNQFDAFNKLKLINLYEVGSTTKNYGYFSSTCDASLYIYGKFDQEYGRSNTDGLIPDMDGYSLINIYDCASGLTLFENYTNIVNTRIRQVISENQDKEFYDISGIPLVGDHFFLSEDNVKYLMNQLDLKKAYIDYCLTILDGLNVDFKFVNTYGDAKTFCKTFTNGEVVHEPLGHIDIKLRWRMKLANASDLSTKGDVISFIKQYIENLNESSDEDLHIPNLLHDIKQEFNDRIVYIEFISFNDNNLGINHIERHDEIESVHVPQEFINVRNRLSNSGVIEPYIDIDLIG